MKRLTSEQQKAVVKQWLRAAPALARAREEELANWKYDAAPVDALLDIGAKSPRRKEEPNGLVEMQKWFMKFARIQGLLPVAHAVQENVAQYDGAGVPPAEVATGTATLREDNGQRPAQPEARGARGATHLKK